MTTLRRYVTTDVFTDRPFGGNPLAVVLDAEGLDSAAMQTIAAEFNYSETSFVLPPQDLAHTAQVRIFTPAREMPFAGHPNLGTAFALAQDLAARGQPVPEHFVFEEIAGLVNVALRRRDGAVTGGELRAPQPLSLASALEPGAIAACLSLQPGDVVTAAHPPQVASVGVPFVLVEVAGLEALGRIRPNGTAWEVALPRDAAQSIYAYVRTGPGTLRSRMFTRQLYEDPATGSATATTGALLLHLSGDDSLELEVRQGVEMGRPSLLLVRARREDGQVKAWVGGDCVPMMAGTFRA
jgi:trans-2,3-dihydro-3-hydroxyanthranilate isomerase